MHDRELVALSTAKNNLESFIYDMRDKLEHNSNYKKAATSDEQTKINEQLAEVDAWLWDDGINADVKVNRRRKTNHIVRLFLFSIGVKIQIR